MIRLRRFRACLPVLMLVGLAAPPAWGETATNLTRSPWWKDIERVAGHLEKERYTKVRKLAPKLARDIAGLSWHHPELPQIFAELALYEAVARAFLDEEDDAVWLWHVAQNIDPKMRDRDVTPYGKAGKLFRENPLRAPGEIPYRWSNAVQGPQFGTSLEPPRKLEEEPPVVLQSSGVKERGATRPLQVEMILDETGRVHQPLVRFPVGAHPAIQWAVLRWVPARAFAPGKVDGEARPFLFTLDVAFEVQRDASEARKRGDGMSG